MERRHRVVRVVLAAEERGELEPLDVALEFGHRPGEVGRHLLVGLVGQELGHRSSIGEAPLELVVAVDLGAEPREAGG